MGLAAQAPGLGELLAEWHLHPAAALALVAAAGAYLLGVRRLSAAGRPGAPAAPPPWPRHRTAAYLLGLAVLAVALQSGIDAYAERMLSMHMLQHMALAMVAPPLILLGAPLTLALRALRRPARRPLAALVRSRGVRAVTRPPIAWVLFAAATVATHLTPLYDAAVRSEALHGVEHLLYLSTGILFWLPLVGANPVPHRPGPVGRVFYLLLAMAPMALVGVTLLSGDEVRYTAYLAPARELGISAVADQHAAALIMWIGGKLLMLVAILLVAWEALSSEERRQAAREAYRDDAAAPAPARGGA